MIFRRWRQRADDLRASPDNTVFWIRIDVCFDQPLDLEGKDGIPLAGQVRGAIMSFGVTAATEDDARQVIEGWVSRDARFAGTAYNLQYDYIGVIDDVNHEIYGDEDVFSALLQDPCDDGIWYRTGVGWYEEDNHPQ